MEWSQLQSSHPHCIYLAAQQAFSLSLCKFFSISTFQCQILFSSLIFFFFQNFHSTFLVSLYSHSCLVSWKIRSGDFFKQLVLYLKKKENAKRFFRFCDFVFHFLALFFRNFSFFSENEFVTLLMNLLFVLDFRIFFFLVVCLMVVESIFELISLFGWPEKLNKVTKGKNN